MTSILNLEAASRNVADHLLEMSTFAEKFAQFERTQNNLKSRLAQTYIKVTPLLDLSIKI